MWFAHWLEPPRRTLAVFLGLMLVFGGTLGWLGWRLVEQDRSLERQRVQERLEQSADSIAAGLQRNLSDIEKHLTFIPGPSAQELPTGVMILLATQGTIETHPAGRLLFYPAIPTGGREPGATFAEGENLEFRYNDPAAAAGIFRVLAKSPDPEVRAGALMRLGRSLRKTGRYQEALQVYSELGRLGSVRVLGLPSELVAREGRCSVLETIGKREELRQEASLMYTALYSGCWSLQRPAWEFRAEEARRWSGDRPVTEREQNCTSALVCHGMDAQPVACRVGIERAPDPEIRQPPGADLLDGRFGQARGCDGDTRLPWLDVEKSSARPAGEGRLDRCGRAGDDGLV